MSAEKRRVDVTAILERMRHAHLVLQLGFVSILLSLRDQLLTAPILECTFLGIQFFATDLQIQ